MVKGTTASGFEFHFEEDAMDDIEVLKLIRELKSDASAMLDLSIKILGEEQFAELQDHVRNEKGIVKASLIDKEMAEILHATTSGKNS